ncbi:MAG: hypothetical protein WED11_04340 [Natronospirillum sp.]
MLNITRRKALCKVGLGAALLTTSLAVMAQPARDGSPSVADWLYLSPGFSWAQHSAVFRVFPADVPLPERHDDIQAVWWDAHPDDVSVEHLHGQEDRLLVAGTTVLLQSDNGIEQGEIMQVLPSGLLIAVGRHARLLAPESYHQLSVPMAGRHLGRLVFNSSQPTPATRTYAYRTGQVTGQVVYRLDMGADDPILTQGLRIDNPSSHPLYAQGLSYHPAPSGGHQPMLSRNLAVESAVSVRDGPAEGVSGQQAVLRWPEPVHLAPHSSQWVQVQQTPLTDVEHEFRWQWHGQEASATPAQWSLTINGEGTLPRLAGSVEVSWFDQAAALLTSHYRSENERQAELSLGENEQVTLTAEATEDAGGWRLRLTNRLDEAAAVVLDLHHPRGYQVDVLPVQKRLDLAPGSTDLSVRFFNQRIEVDAP